MRCVCVCVYIEEEEERFLGGVRSSGSGFFTRNGMESWNLQEEGNRWRKKVKTGRM